MANQKKGLGRGLDALLGGPQDRMPAVAPQRPVDNKPNTVSAAPVSEKKTPQVGDVIEVPLHQVEPNPDQPRTYFKKEEIEELAGSISKEGLLQPILVRKKGDRYQIIAGERRWQACRSLGLKRVPIRVWKATEDEALELALVENIQRSDLNPIEEAYGYKRMMDRRHMTQADVAKAVSKGRSTIANALRLLELPEAAQRLLFEGKISAGHARAILSISNKLGRDKLTERLTHEKLSVRETEEAARRIIQGEAEPKKPVSSDKATEDHSAYDESVDKIAEALGCRVKVKNLKKSNRLEITFKSEEELHRICDVIINGNQD